MSDFWSRRRAAVQAESRAERDARDAAERAQEEAALAERPDEELLAELELRAPEEMESPEEIQALLRAALPQRLKTRALRRLWRLNPVLANLDGLNDYDDDYTVAATAGQVVRTAYQVGRGFVTRMTETDTAPEATRDDRDAEVGPQVAPPEGHDTALPEPDDTPAPDPRDHAEASAPPAAPRRMRFSFETAT